MSSTIRIATVSDLAFNGAYGGLARSGQAHAVLREVGPLLQSDLIIGNLENPLTERPTTAPSACA